MSADIDTILQQAQVLRTAGDLAAAEKILAEAQRAFPGAVEFPAHLGDVRLAQGRGKKAAEAFRDALKLAPGAVVLLVSLAAALEAAGDLAGAVEALSEALVREPENAAIHNNFGLLLRRTGQGRAAVAALQRAVDLAPEKAAYHANQARVLQDVGDLQPARRAAEKSLELDPQSADALVNLGCILRDLDHPGEAVRALKKACSLAPEIDEAWLNLGLAHRDAGQPGEAVQAFGELLARRPRQAEAQANLGRILHETMAFADSEAAYLAALDIRPRDAQTLNNFATLLNDADRPDQAEEACRRALEIEPDHLAALSNLANLRLQAGDPLEALELNARAGALAPDDRQIRRNRADPLFLSGDLAAGWQALEARWHETRRPRRPFGQPLWQNQDIAGQTLLVWSEQGVGDTILFAGCLPDLLKRAGRVIVEVDARLVPLFERSFPAAQFVARSDPPDAALTAEGIDRQCPIGDLGRWLRRDLSAFPDDEAYLQADAARIEHWRGWLAGLAVGPKLGFCWTSGLMDAERWRHYPALDDWQAILAVEGVQFICLQYGDHADELNELRGRYGGRIHLPPEIDLFDDLDDIAALSAALDGFVSPETANSWLAAALGVPAWVMCQPGDWRTLGSGHLPWLPGVRMVEKQRGASWRTVAEAVAAQIQV